jgi:membrane protease YdiL (CAAX protease family)
MNGTSRRRAAALLEVLGVYLAGPLAMFEVRRVLGISVTNPLNNLTVNATGADLVTASWQMFTLLILQYLGYFMLAAPLDWWYRRRGVAAYGLTTAGHSLRMLLLAGIGTAALWELPVLSISLANSIHPSPTVPWRQALMDMSWQRWQFWLFTAVSSWALVPFLEELFYRGYCQRRLAEDWGNGPAIFGAACLFTFTHTQYLRSNAYSAGMMIGLLLSAIGFGVVFAWTRSLITSTIAHALFDIPLTTVWQSVVLAALVLAAVVMWRRAIPLVKQVFSTQSTRASVALGIIGAGYAILASRDELLIYIVAIGMVLLAVLLEAKDRLRERAANH